MADKMRFTSDKIDVSMLLIDSSGSMDKDRKKVIRGIGSFKKELVNTIEANSMAICRIDFNDEINLRQEFKSIDELDDTTYYPNGGTALYRAIAQCGEKLIEYYDRVLEANKCTVNGSFVIQSDGLDSWKKRSEFNEAKKIVEKMKKKGFVVAFVPYRDAINSGIPEQLGFTDIRRTKKGEDIEDIIGKELSRSYKIQSKSMATLTGSFFDSSKKSNSSISGFRPRNDEISKKVLEDQDFFNC